MRSKISFTKLRITFAAVFAVVFAAAGSFAQSDGSQQNQTGKAGTFAIRDVRIVTVSGPVIEKGTVVIRDGKIAAIGAGADIPRGAEIIDGEGLSVYPGMIDAGTAVGLAEIGQGANATVDVAETGNMNANAKAIKGINPHSSHINVTRVNGITTVLSVPTGGLIAGQAAVINLNGSTQADMAVVPEFGLVINFPRVSLFGGFVPGVGRRQIDFREAVKRRDEQIGELKNVFAEAERYGRAKDAYANDNSLPFPAVDIKLDAMLPYIRGERPIIFTADRERDIRAVANFVGEMKVKGIILGGQEAAEAVDALKKHNLAVIFKNIYNLPVREDDPFDYFFTTPSVLARAGVPFAISTGDQGGEVRDLPYHAGLASAYGLSKEDALRSVTLFPAQILGIADRTGTLETGKMANVVVTDGDILEPRTNIKYMFINGRLIPLTSRHTELFESFKDRK